MMPVSLIWFQEPHRDLVGETRGSQFSHTSLAPAQLLGPGTGISDKISFVAVAVLPSHLHLPSEKLWGEGLPRLRWRSIWPGRGSHSEKVKDLQWTFH